MINWDDNPLANKDAKQVIYSTHSSMLPDGDYNIYVGKVIEKIYVSRDRKVVIRLRKPIPEDISEENLNRQPLSASTTAAVVTPDQAETIKKPYTQEDLIRMRREIMEAEIKARKIYGGEQ